jgi:hypothetical protein
LLLAKQNIEFWIFILLFGCSGKSDGRTSEASQQPAHLVIKIKYCFYKPLQISRRNLKGIKSTM